MGVLDFLRWPSPKLTWILERSILQTTAKSGYNMGLHVNGGGVSFSF